MLKQKKGELLARLLIEARNGVERLARCGGHPSPQDFFGDIVLELFEGLRRLPQQRMTATYVLSVARWRLQDFWRASPPYKTLALDEERHSQPTGPSDIDQAKRERRPDSPLAAAMHECVSRLRRRSRQYLIARYVESMSTVAIAKRYHVAPEVVRASLYRARRSLQSRMTKIIEQDNLVELRRDGRRLKNNRF